jgi:superfamily I DNA/RNA helicase
MHDQEESFMAQRKLLLGPPGCGKTHQLLQKVKTALESGVPPDRIGFVSFSRKAVQEARDRAAEAFGLTERDLPYFKTLHAMGFHLLGLQSSDVMSQADWQELGREVGLDINGVDDRSAKDGLILPASYGGDAYISILERARMRCVSLQQEFSEARNYSLSFSMLERTESALEIYKSTFGKLSFVDMIDLAVTNGNAPYLDLLIIDEAQDLTPLQWKLANAMAERATEVVIAGDDDQAIHRWAGVDVRLFMECSTNIEILKQSYRLPISVHRLSQGLVRRISNRFDKAFLPTTREGRVDQLMSPHNLDLSSGSFTIMTRTNSFVREWAEMLRYNGYMFEMYGNSSVPRKLAEAVDAWRRLQAGGALYLGEVKALYTAMPKLGDGAGLTRGATKLLAALDPERAYSYEMLSENCGLIAPKDRGPLSTLRVGNDMSAYIEALERRGEYILDKPRIKVSTMHAMKGGEDENIVVDTSSTKGCVFSPFQDDEHRTFYVGVTRAKSSLTIINSSKKYRYMI